MELSTFLGSFGSYQGRATYGQTAAGIEMLVSATYYTSSGQSLFFPEYSNPTTNNGVARNADDERARNFYGQIGFGKFFLRGAAVSREKGIPTGAFGTVFNNPSTRTFDNFRSFDAQYHAPIARGWELSLRGSYDLYSYDGRYLWSDPTLPDPILNADGCRGEWWGAEASIYHQFPAHNKVTAGLEVRDDFRQDQFSYDVQPYWSYLDDKRKSWMAALYVQDEITLSPKIVLNLGFRHDRYSTFGGTTNPRAALIYQPGRGATLKFLYGTAFRAPSAYELYYRSFIIKNNPRLVPETIRTFELIFEKDLRRHLHMAISGYDNKLGNLINQTADPADGLAFFQNLGRVKSRGAELELTARWLTGLEGRASYSLQRTTDRATGLALSNSPLHMAKLGLIVPVVRNNLFVSLDSWYMSRRRTLSGSSIGGFPVFNSTLLSRNLGKHTEFSAGLYNLFDKNYADPGAEDHMQDALQQDGRNFRVKLTFRF